MEACNQAEVRYIELPVAFDTLTVVVNPQTLTENRRFLREEIDREGYRWLLAIASLDGLV
jgi:succinylglutamate desuccinylase